MHIVVIGAKGRLGSQVVNEARAANVSCASVARGELVVALAAPVADTVVVDVATPGSTAAHAAACAAAGVPYLVATTGLADADRAALDDASKRVPVLAAANLSVSAHVAARIVKETAGLWSGADIEVVEMHHNQKKDAPSGTALMLARAAADGRGVALEATLKKARDGHAPRADGEIGVVAVRGGDVVGEHTVFFFGKGERIEIAHRVTDRAIFARGALVAARFLAGKPAGRYEMKDVVG